MIVEGNRTLIKIKTFGFWNEFWKNVCYRDRKVLDLKVCFDKIILPKLMIKVWGCKHN